VVEYEGLTWASPYPHLSRWYWGAYVDYPLYHTRGASSTSIFFKPARGWHATCCKRIFRII